MAYVSLALVVCDMVQRLVIAPWVGLRPSRRIPVLGGWMKVMAWVVTVPVAFITGSVIPRPARIVPTKPGVLVVMNHQSLFDIPLVAQTVADGYPRIVTRKRYARFIPVISHMIKLYRHPVVDPSASREIVRDALDELEAAAAETDVPLAVFPEGTRTKDGTIGHFKVGGLARILSTRPWTVYVYVTDGFWRVAKYKDFVRRMTDIDGRIEHVGTLEWTDPKADPVPFVNEIREMMVERLRVMRGQSAVA